MSFIKSWEQIERGQKLVKMLSINNNNNNLKRKKKASNIFMGLPQQLYVCASWSELHFQIIILGVGQIGHVLAAFCSKVWPHCGSTSSVSGVLREIDRRSTGITISDSVPEFSNFGPDNASFILFYSKVSLSATSHIVIFSSI